MAALLHPQLPVAFSIASCLSVIVYSYYYYYILRQINYKLIFSIDVCVRLAFSGASNLPLGRFICSKKST